MILTGDQKTDFFTVMALIDSFAEASGGKIKAKEDSLFALTKRIHIVFSLCRWVRKCKYL
jgi:hypothetical protein